MPVQHLNPISTPLQTTTLIEASAGTGKTFTMASLYLRLLLQAGDNAFSVPLTVEQILVVTFTEASTEELKERIRARIHLAKAQFAAYRETQDLTVFLNTDNEFLVKENGQLTDRFLAKLDPNEAFRRLGFAEQNMDLAAVYTIHGFCRRMLMQYAVNSGIHFNLELVTDETDLLNRLANDFWREQFYGQSFVVTEFIHRKLESPQQVLKKIRAYLKGETLKVSVNRPHLLTMSTAEFLQQELAVHLAGSDNIPDELKSAWTDNFAEISALFEANYAGASVFNGNKFKRDYFIARTAKIQAWADSERRDIPDELWYFTQDYLNGAVLKGKTAFSHPFFDYLAEQKARIEAAQTQLDLDEKILLFHYLRTLNERLSAYKRHHPEKSFDDLLRLLKNALQSERGEQLATFIRHQYPFAMVDEFQDTDEQQYQIFSAIYVNRPDCGFMMIGDPKQAIYQFRGADIFTYLKAAKDAEQERFTLSKNYRSDGSLIRAVNGLFDFPAAFMYDDIRFEPVAAGKDQAHFVWRGAQQAPMAFYLGSREQAAEYCADNIRQWLTSADENQAGFVMDTAQDNGRNLRLRPENIAVLVRKGSDAEKIKSALQRRGIASVYLSDRTNVFDCAEARELAFILAACLNPFSERHIMNALATGIFAFSMAQLQQIKRQAELLDGWMTRFEDYQRIWRRQGVLPMLHRIFLDKGKRGEQADIVGQIAAQANAERRLTDLLHLAELLQEAAVLHESESALLSWFERQIQGKDRQAEQQVRLESERNLVKIVTIHKSKGLEYDLVWLPFLGFDDVKNRDEISIFHDKDAEALWDMNARHQDISAKEKLAEEMRLLYVALTRAKYQVAMALPAEFGGKKESYWNPVWYALSRGEIGDGMKITGKAEKQTAVLLSAHLEAENYTLETIPETVSGDKWLPQTNAEVSLSAATFTGKIEQNWGVTSFTALSRMHEQNRRFHGEESAVEFTAIFDDALDYDEQQDVFSPTDEEANALWRNLPAEYSPLALKGGAKFGVILHRFFEKHDFSQPIEDAELLALCQGLQLDETWIQPLKMWLEAVLTTPLSAGFKLTDIRPQHCLKEMQFYLNLDRTFDVKAFNLLLRQYHPLYQQPYLLDDIRGMLRGFIDLVYRHDGKYYLLDYKTNLLPAYSEERIRTDIQQHYYDLQYLLYSLALHCFLQRRLPAYDYETHFGGVIYAYVRGMDGSGKTGVFTTRPAARLIRGLEELLHA
ncbi:exodeoxyribonuclease V subunit beta [Actinobacillus succinogenes]|uniref:RecBCD enzyme subunit RecB n=1 Tax=Actinobacillus succinogenes (strain ATCC 55618 / DSM 22257 / CCUG 43843 / 130Z) TaxID=339671 RepID=A6VNJ9_ACTSZ|nr:exodeoxyribonuclease V subunit beta [Actinobacillus succinogenes]ABR74546.1 exodeoxyribonuclease V, beta subunit [Actinobacillus succinogenes 130Z]PHI41033.1 exodeoxyribonuclease V subunit beta [Actinobacillus succinogenes]